MNIYLSKKIKKSHQIIRKALGKWRDKIALAWTGGKDSTVMLHMVRSLSGKVDLPVFYLDTGLDAPETYEFLKAVAKKWDFSITKMKDPKGLTRFHQTKSRKEKSKIAAQMKINLLNQALEEYKWKALFIGIRSDEHPARRNEQFFSKRKNHIRVHPILHFTEKNIWEYIAQKKVPYNPLYDKGFRSLGEEAVNNPEPFGKKERDTRDRYKESIMKKLRALGYF